jgi:diguanylate cyclase (GGDEF)-like protein/PAS domain S-box-containing protein
VNAIWSRVPSRSGQVGLILLILAGIALAVAGPFVSDPITATRDLATTHGYIHGIAAMVGIPALSLQSLGVDQSFWLPPARVCAVARLSELRQIKTLWRRSRSRRNFGHSDFGSIEKTWRALEPRNGDSSHTYHSRFRVTAACARSDPPISLGTMQVVEPHRVHGTENGRSAPSAHDLVQVLQQSGEAVIVKNMDAVVTYWNREAEALYGFSAEEAIGQPLRKLHAAELSETDYAALLARIRAGRPASSSTERRKKNGEMVRVIINTTPLLDEQGALVGEITIARDVTSVFEKEEASRRLQAPDSVARVAIPSNPILRAWRQGPYIEILVGLAVLVSTWICMVFTRVPGGITLFWPGSAIAAALLIRLPRIRWISAAVSISLALLVAHLFAAHRSWPIAALFTADNLTEIALMVAMFRTWRFPYPNITINQSAIMSAIFGIVIPGVAAIGGGLILHLNFAIPFVEGTLQLWSSHTIGACLLGPPIILFSVKGVRRLLQGSVLAVNGLTLLLCLMGCYLTIRYVRFPFVSMALLLLIAAFRMGGLGASLMSLCFGLMISTLWILGIQPLGLEHSESTGGSLLGMPTIAFLATVMPSIAVGLGSDARRAAARALRISERRFRESMEYSPIGMLISDLNGIWAYTNIALQQMLGYTAEEFRALPPGGPSKAEDWRESQARWKRLVSGDFDSDSVARSFQHKDGHWVWTQVAVSVLRDEEGLPINLIAQIESLEARRRAEESLAEERERLRITLQSIHDAVITTDAQTHVTYINAAAECLLGLDVTAVKGRPVDEVIHLLDPQSSKAAAHLIGQSALHGKVFRRERPCLLMRADGTFCYVIDIVSPVLETTGAVSGTVIVLRDVTLDMDRSRDLQHRAMHDPLTGLSNRADFDQRLRTVFGKARELDRPAAVVAIDLDRFKAVNDAAGHAAGDAVLCKVAAECRLIVRSSDTIARLGGDEFAIILDNCPEERAKDIGQRLLQALNPLELEWQGSRYRIGASIGVAMNRVDIADAKSWLEAADKACYDAKRGGRGRLQIATGVPGEEL